MLDAARKAIMAPGTKVVCFDVFDTLLVRPVVCPGDLFYLVEQRIRAEFERDDFPFIELRRKAEGDAREKLRRVKPSYDDVTLDEIYDCLPVHEDFSASEIARMKQIELDVERKYLTARKPIFELYELALKLGRRIIVASDTSLPSIFLAEALTDCGYAFDRLYLSCELRKSKAEGGLFAIILRDMDVKPTQLVHIGSGDMDEFKMARRYNIRACHVPSPIDSFRNARTSFEIWKDFDVARIEPSYRLVLGLIINSVFDEMPKEGWKKESLFNGNPYLLGFYGLGPFAFCACLWVLKNSSEKGADSAAFLAPDGLLFMRIYEQLQTVFAAAPSAKYVHFARSTGSSFDGSEPAELVSNQNPLHIDETMTAEAVLTKKLNLNPSDAFVKYLAENGYALDQPVGKLADFYTVCLLFDGELFDGFDDRRNMLGLYLTDVFEKSRTVALFDIGAAHHFQNILSSHLKMSVLGQFLFTPETEFKLDKQKFPHDYFLSEPAKQLCEESEALQRMVTTLMSEQELGNLVELDGLEVKQVAILGAIQRGALDLTNQLVISFGEDLQFFQISGSTAMLVLGKFIDQPFALDAALFRDLSFSNGATAQDSDSIDNSEALSAWKSGFHAISQGHDVRRSNTEDQSDYYGYGVFGWRRLYTPVIRYFVRKLGTERDLALFDHNPRSFFRGLSNQKYVKAGRVLYP